MNNQLINKLLNRIAMLELQNAQLEVQLEENKVSQDATTKED
ncbi:hypothetical protein [Limosilactobacillus ingluviei]|nr:hypothetical protein [Limosilactobacillus ingluviei]